MTPHERAVMTMKALQLRKKKRENVIRYYEAEKRHSFFNQIAVNKKRIGQARSVSFE